MEKVSLTQFTENSLKEIWQQGFQSINLHGPNLMHRTLMIIKNLQILNHSKKVLSLNFY